MFSWILAVISTILNVTCYLIEYLELYNLVGQHMVTVFGICNAINQVTLTTILGLSIGRIFSTVNKTEFTRVRLCFMSAHWTLLIIKFGSFLGYMGTNQIDVYI